MTHAKTIYESIPDEVKRQFKLDVVLSVNRLIEEIEFKYPSLSNQDKGFLTALGQAHGAGHHSAVYEAFGKVLSE